MLNKTEYQCRKGEEDDKENQDKKDDKSMSKSKTKTMKTIKET